MALPYKAGRFIKQAQRGIDMNQYAVEIREEYEGF